MSETLGMVIIFCTFFLTVGGVLVLRPIAKRLGGFLDAMTQAKLRPSMEPELTRIREALNSIDMRLNQIEERQDFAEALISASDPKLVNGPAPLRAPERN